MIPVAARGWVLGTTAYAEADKIATIYTLQLGRVKALVKGIRKPKSKLASSIDLFTESSFNLHKRATGSLYVLGQAKVLDGHGALKNDFQVITSLQVLAEVIIQSTPEAEPHPEVYELLKQTLATLEEHPRSSEVLLAAFGLKLMEDLGYPLELENCAGCGEVIDKQKIYLVPHRGGALCEGCLGSLAAKFQVNKMTLEVLKKLRRTPTDRVHVLKLQPIFSRQILMTVMGYLERTLEKPFRSLEYYATVLPLESA